MNDVCRFSRDHVVECSERTVLSCLEKYLPKRRQHKHTGSRQDKTVLSEHSTTNRKFFHFVNFWDVSVRKEQQQPP